MKRLADRGLCVAFDKDGKPLKNRVAYESGHIDQLDVAVRRAVMTGVNQLNQKYREQSMDYLETDLVEVTAHLGARNIDGPNGWENHAKWQGGVYRWAAKPKASNGKYPDFEDTCGYGSVTGIGGANCRHSYWPFIEGVSERTYTDSELEAMKPENRPKIEFEGRKYDDYQATQKQRQIERTVRKLKRRKTAFEAAGLKEDAQATNIRLRRLSKEYSEFSKAARLPEQRERMRVAYPGDITEIQKFSPLKEYQGDIKVVGQFSPKEYVVKLDPPKLSGVRQHVLENEQFKADRAGLNLEAAQSIIDNSRLALYQSHKKTIKFLSDKGYVVINMKKEAVTVVPEKLRKKYRDYLEGK